MAQPASDAPHEPSSARVLLRFAARLIILVACATFSADGFGKALAALLALAEVFCVTTAAMRREAPFGHVLTHWDEAAAYALLNVAVARLS